MSTSTTPDWAAHAPPVVSYAEEERAAFIRNTYAHLLGGLIIFGAVCYAMMGSEALMQFLVGPARWVGLIGLIGLSLGYRKLFSSPNISTHYVAYGLTIALEAALVSPLFYFLERMAPGVLQEAFWLTSLAFGGLTAIVFVTKKDFSFMGGALSLLTFALLGVGLVGMFFGGVTMTTWYAAASVVIFGGWVLYDTDQIRQHLPLNGYVMGATMLFIDFVIMLVNIAKLLAISRE